MTTWLRVGVEGNRQEQSFFSLSDMPQRPFLIKKHFLTNHILVIGILATGCRLIASSSTQGILYLPMVVSCPCGYRSCPVAHDKNCLPPNNQVCHRSIIYLYLSNTYTFIAQHLYSSILLCSNLFMSIDIRDSSIFSPLTYHMLGSQSNNGSTISLLVLFLIVLL